MKLSKKLLTLQATLHRLNLKYARLRMIERKQDTRNKIQLGGLVKKAGLAEEPVAVILGLLLEAKEKLTREGGKVVWEQYRLHGDLVLTYEKAKNKLSKS